MRTLSVKLLLLLTFAFWATGSAKYVHERIAHHGGHPAGVADQDDDGDPGQAAAAPTLAAAAADHGLASPLPHPTHPCPVCQLLVAMAVDRLPPVVAPAPSIDPVGHRIVTDVPVPRVHPGFTYPATGPPLVPAATV